VICEVVQCLPQHEKSRLTVSYLFMSTMYVLLVSRLLNIYLFIENPFVLLRRSMRLNTLVYFFSGSSFGFCLQIEVNGRR